MDWFNNSKLFDLAKQGQRLPHIRAVILLSFLFVLIVQMGAMPIVIITSFWRVFQFPHLWMALESIFDFILAYVFLWIWLKFFEKRPFWTLGYELKDAFKQYTRGFLFGILMIFVILVILNTFGNIEFSQVDTNQQGLAAIGIGVLVLSSWVIQGCAEEVLIRGWLLPVIGAQYKPWIGLLISSLIFVSFHAFNLGLNIITILNLGLFGIFVGLYAMREGSIWGVSAVHSVWNWVQGNFFGFEVSGTQADGGTLINLTETGADWLTGGSFGPEGGVAVTIVLLIGIAVILFWKDKKINNKIILISN